MSAAPEGPEGQLRSPTSMTAITLAVILILYPLLYCSGFMGELVRPIIADNSRTHWWYFWLANMFFHWGPFVMVWVAVRHERTTWLSIGVDWLWFWRMRWWIALIFVALGVAAFLMPKIHYGNQLPGQSQTIFMAPVSEIERLWVIWGAVTAAVTEEVLFRGYVLTRLPLYLRNVWFSLSVSVIAFVFIHGHRAVSNRRCPTCLQD